MKTFLLSVILLITLTANTQITTPIVKAGFGVDADLRANYFNGFVQAGSDDWFTNGTPGSGQFVIDTAGAAAMMARYAVDPSFRKLPFYRTMRVPQFSIVNNRLWIDAVYIRDYNGQAGGDSTAFVTSNKNGDSPSDWEGGITSVLDKNDIAEMMIHVKRAGPSKSDSLWFMGGMSLQGTTGNRYFDFELYQTDIFYSRATGEFTNFGPDAGHTSWKFDAGGNIIAPGDVIFTAEYSSSSLTNIEARIWINKNDLSITPTGFDWAGSFDGASAGSQYGYANIRPKTAGTYYTGLQSGNNTWAGPFGFIDGGNNLKTTYTARQFMEFSVNLTKLGLDPMTLLGGSACGLPFRRILVKTRSSTSFTSELKDFIGPFDFFNAPAVQAQADVPLFCGVLGVSEIRVQNPSSASVYTWSTIDGSIYGSTTGEFIIVDTPGTYIVTQQLLDGCTPFASDTVVITWDSNCVPMENNLTSFSGDIFKTNARLSWSTKANNETSYFDVQRSLDGINYQTIGRVHAVYSENSEGNYGYTDDISNFKSAFVFYRLKVVSPADGENFSGIARLGLPTRAGEMNLFPNPVKDQLQISFSSTKKEEASLVVYDFTGALVHSRSVILQNGQNLLQYDARQWKQGAYILEIRTTTGVTRKKFLVARNTSL